MKHVIIGTAGHVDHGKSTLIRALTGIETDRLREEQKRGITIDLGFAWLDLPDGGKAGIVDVPGHEKFVHNMLSGAGGIDLALLIVAADEGVMPQTEEHLSILSLLDIKDGIIVITKTDMVEEDWLELAEETIIESVEGTFFEGAPIFRCSAYTGDGVDELREEIFKKIASLPEKNENIPFREPVDRIFTIGGFGTVVTGTIFEGKVELGDTVQLYPSGKEFRVRSIQVHEEDQKVAYAGQRTAINLAQAAKEDIQRGEMIATPGSMDNSQTLDVHLRVLPNSEFNIKDRSRVHFHYGANESIAQVRLLDRKLLKAGESTVARLNFQEDVAVKFGDPYVLRFFSPLVTIGGGHVLDPCPRTYKIKNKIWHERLEKLLNADAKTRFYLAIDSASPYFSGLAQAIRRAGLDVESPDSIKEILDTLESEGLIFKLNNEISISVNFLNKLQGSVLRILEKFHQENPLKLGVKRESLRTSLLSEQRQEYTDKILNYFIEQGSIKESNGLISLAGFTLSLSPEEEAVQEQILAFYEKSGYSPLDKEEVIAKFPKKQNPEALISHLIDQGKLIRLDDKINMHPRYVEAARDFVVKHIQENGSIKLAEVRDKIGSSRRFAIAILDYFDRQKLTRMQGDVRILL